MTRTIIVTDGEQRAALAAVRSLGKAGWRVVVCAARMRSLAGASRHAAAEHRVPDPLHEPDAFGNAVIALTASEHASLVLPISEPSLLSLLPRRQRLAPARIPFPDVERFRCISDKAALQRHARETGIAVPTQVELSTRADIAGVESVVRLPVVLKPARSIGEREGKLEKLGVRHAATVTELKEQLGLLSDAAFPVLVQQRIVGPGVGIFLLVWDGRVMATFAHRRIREKPPSGGVSVYRESIPADPDLVARSRALLSRFDWSGPAMIEYKIDAATGTPFLMEINGRFWGSLQLAIDAGVDFPLLLAHLAVGDDVAPVTSYRTGVRSRWWLGDVDHLIARMTKSSAQLALPPDAPGRGRALVDFLRLWWPGDRSEVLRLSDPWPGFREAIAWMRRA